jgi:predicted dithiol-disulfide oxidoreductase (DUF899 family)
MQQEWRFVMGKHHDHRFPGESDAYRVARDALLDAEIALRRQEEEVAVARRQLPPGGAIREDYLFTEVTPEGDGSPRHLSQLFAPDHDTLLIYSLMLAEGGTPCSSCTAIVTGLDRVSRQFGAHVDFAVVAKASVPTLRGYAARMDWMDVRLLSWGGTSYGNDYFGEDEEGRQQPMLNAFVRDADGIHHSWASELMLAPAQEGQEPRHVDMIWPFWKILDLTPGGRAGREVQPIDNI